MSRILLLTFTVLSLTAQTVDRTKPPASSPIPTFKLPPISESKLPNGLSVVLVEDSRFPLISVRLSFAAGSKYDPNDLPGLSGMAANLVTEGTKTRSSRQIAEELGAIGGSLTGSSNPETLVLGGSVLAENAAKLLDLLADVTLNATFPEDEVKLRKQNRKQVLMAQRSQPDFLAREKLNAIVFSGHPYAHIAPTMQSIDAMDQKTLVTFRDTFMSPNGATLILLGKLPARAEALKMIRDRFAVWQQKTAPAPPAAKFPPAKRELVLIDRPGSVQADILVGHLAAPRTNPEYYPLMTGSVILGGGPSSRMFNEIREKKGYAYDAHTELNLAARKDTGLFTAVTQVRNEVLEPAMAELLAELAGMGKDRVTAEELSDAKNFISGNFLLSLETQDSLATQLERNRSQGLAPDYLEKFTTRVRSVEPDQIQTEAKKFMNPEEATIVVVGDGAKIQKSLEKFGSVQVTKAN